MTRGDRRALATLVAGWAIVIVLLGTGGEVALDDSWNFAKPVRYFLATGQLEFDPFNSAASVPHVLWGALVCKLLGFSLAACQIANFIAALAALMAAYAMARAFGLGPAYALAVTATTAASPPFFVTMFTFQSDFWYLLPAWAGIAFVLRFLRQRRDLDLVIGSLCIAGSIWNKIHGVFLAGAIVVLLFLWRRKGQIRWRSLAFATGIPALSFVLFELALPFIHPVRTTMVRKNAEFISRLVNPTVWLTDGPARTAVVLLSLGVYGLPLLAVFHPFQATRRTKTIALLIAFTTTACSAVYWLWQRSEWFPFTSSVLREWPPLQTPAILVLLTSFGLMSSFVLIASLVGRLSDGQGASSGTSGLLALATLSQLLPLVPILLFMDRYFLVFIPWIFLLALSKETTANSPPLHGLAKAFAVALLVAMLAFGVLRVTQYRNGVAAQWAEADRVVANQHVVPLAVDGGYSWFGWHNYPECLANRPSILQPNELNSGYVVELCPWAPIRFDVVFHEMAPPRVLRETIRWSDPTGGPGLLYVYERPAPLP